MGEEPNACQMPAERAEVMGRKKDGSHKKRANRRACRHAHGRARRHAHGHVRRHAHRHAHGRARTQACTQARTQAGEGYTCRSSRTHQQQRCLSHMHVNMCDQELYSSWSTPTVSKSVGVCLHVQRTRPLHENCNYKVDQLAS